MRESFLSWYRKYYLLVNLPLLLLVTELVITVVDPISLKPNDLDAAYASFHARPAQDAAVVLLLGNSGMQQGVDAEQLEAALSRPGHPVRVYNFAVSAARIDDVAELTRRLLAAGMKPKAIVLGLNPFLVDDHVNADSRFPWLSRASPYLYFHRSIIRGLLKKALRGEMGNPDEFGFNGSDGVQTDAQRDFAIDAFSHEFEHRPADDYPLMNQVPLFLSELADRGINTNVVLLPISPDASRRLSSFPELIANVRSLAPAGSLDLVERFSYTRFKDIGHVNLTGRKELTSDLASWLSERLSF